MKNLEQSLLNAKKFMEHQAMNTRKTNSPRVPRTESVTPVPNTQMLSEQPMQMPSIPNTSTPNMNPKSNMSRESIMNSKLPDAIKKAMIDTPIPDVNATPNLSESFMEKVSQKMNSEEYSVQNMRNTANSNVNRVEIPTMTNTPKPTQKDSIPSPFQSEGIDKNSLKETIKDCIKEILKEENILLESQNVKDTLQLRVGNKIFTGTIKNVKTIKK